MSTVVPPTDSDTVSASGLIRYIAANRSTVAMILAAVGIIGLGLGIYGFYKGLALKTPETSESESDSKMPKDDLLGETAAVHPHRAEYVTMGGIGVLAALVGIGLAAYAGLSIPSPTTAGQYAAARALVLLAGALFGLVLMMGAAAYFYLWSESLTNWIESRKTSEAKWIIGPILVFLIGAGLAFLSAMPARVDERNDPNIRRFVYGTNVGLTIVLVLLALVVGNVFAALKIPNKLDTTESGMHSIKLANETRDYLVEMKRTIRAYAILGEDDVITADIRRLLEACQEASPDHFLVRYLSPVTNQKDVVQLRNKYPQIDIAQTGVLLVLDENEKQVSYIRKMEFYKTDGARGGSVSFIGESKLGQEILLLTEDKSQPTVYFTQSSGELSIQPPAPGNPLGADGQTRPANEIRTQLEKTNCKVQPLVLDARTDPKIPDDCDILVIADPTAPLTEKMVAAIRTYMTNPRSNGKKGRLMLLAGVHRQPFGGPGVMSTGLEPLLAEYGIRLTDYALYAAPATDFPAAEIIARTSTALVQNRNTIGTSTSRYQYFLKDCRVVAKSQEASPLGATSDVLLVTYPENRETWIESAPLTNPDKTYADFDKAPERVLVQKNLGLGTRPLGAIASDDSGGRIVVIGSGSFADQDVRVQGGLLPQVELFTVSTNWLRDRKPIANLPAKSYGQYTPPVSVSDVRVFWFPVALVLGSILAMGLGVWVLRRK